MTYPRMQPRNSKTDRHFLDDVADEVRNSMNSEATWLAEAMRGGHPAPFSARISEAQKLEYFRRKTFVQNPDGSIDYEKPNTEGRDQIIQQYGEQGYIQIMSGVLGARESKPPIESEVPSFSMPEEPEEGAPY